MAEVSLHEVSKIYPGGTQAVSDLSLDIADGEFMVLVGPSGCGKTTALRMVAGLESISSGTVTVGGKVINDLSPRDRDIAMVFQNYALYPHMTVAQNIGFALQLRKMDKAEVRKKVADAADILGLREHLDRKPGQLSGGQRQRVAMGRAIVRQPAAFLMDEPLSNLDAKLRVQMRAEISRVQRRLGVATLYVTHDQTEAMTMGDRVAVLRGGALQQCAAPQVLYDRPANLFVAAFIGSPAMNLYEGTLDPDRSAVHIGPHRLALPPDMVHNTELDGYWGRGVVVGIRPENLADAAGRDGEAPGPGPGRPVEDRCIEGRVELVEALGSEKLVHLRTDAARVRPRDAAADNAEEAAALEGGEIGSSAGSDTVARVLPSSKIVAGERARLLVDVDRLHLFDAGSGAAIHSPVSQV